MTSEGPLVSVYIATYNRKPFLERAVRSVQNQTYRNIEILVADDCSTDGTPELMESLCNEDSSIVYIRLDSQGGAPRARNEAIKRARGKYITGLDDDDWFSENRVERFMDNYSENWSCLCSNLQKYDGLKTSNDVDTSGEITFDKIKKGNLVGNQVFIETRKLRELEGFDPDFVAWQDYELWFRVIKQYGPALKLTEATYIHNVQDNIDRISNARKSQKGMQQFLDKFECDLSDDEVALQKINHYSNHRIKPELKEYMRLCSPVTVAKLFRLYVKTSLPGLFNSYQSFFRKVKRNSVYRKIRKIVRSID